MLILIAKIVCLTVIAIYIIVIAYLWLTTSEPTDAQLRKAYKERWGEEWTPPKVYRYIHYDM
ncbi:MAG: hypothetical protein LBF19_04155 [Prevotellaceae bacterium]|jgi:hypothetical protein|nr:hypothetical protein [Prevotellaceae bacterium]